MKGLFLANINPQKSIGYMPKIFGQVRGFEQLGYSMELIYFGQNSQIMLADFAKDLKEPIQLTVLAQPRENFLSRKRCLLKIAKQQLKKSSPDFIYLRYPRADPLYLQFLKTIRKHLPHLIILSEFPTYPYDKEYEKGISVKDKLVFLLDKLTRPHLFKLIDRVVSINYEQPIFGMQTISIDNGITPSDYPPLTDTPNLLNSIKIIGVANVSYWHGYDRIIRGIGKYYRNNKQSTHRIEFHVVGAIAPYIYELRELIRQENLAESVILHKPNQGELLDSFFIGCHLAIGVLGGHRKGLDVMSPLKNREYCARGIPFVISHIDPDFTEDFQYCLRVKSDESPIEINELIKFINQLNTDESINYKMRNYAFKRLNWKEKLSPVRNYINEKSK